MHSKFLTNGWNLTKLIQMYHYNGGKEVIIFWISVTLTLFSLTLFSRSLHYIDSKTWAMSALYTGTSLQWGNEADRF